MPTVLNYMGYHIYFWSNENGEPVHVHISKGDPSPNATKVWITQGKGVLIEHNRSRIPQADLKKLLVYITANVMLIESKWVYYFGMITYRV